MSSASVVRTLKSYCGEDLRRFPLPSGRLPPLSQLKQQLASAYGLAAASLHLKYVDEEGEQVTVCSEEDLRAAEECAREEGSKFVRIHVYAAPSSTAAAPAAPAVVPAPATAAAASSVKAEVKTKSAVTVEDETEADTKPEPKPAPTPVKEESAKKSDATSSSSADASSSVHPQAERVLAALRSFFADGAVTGALPAALCLFLDTLAANGGADVGQSVRFTLDAFPALKDSELGQMALEHLDHALPLLDAALEPLKVALAGLGEHGVAQAKAMVSMFAPVALAFVSDAVTKLDARTLERAWELLQQWAEEPTAAFPCAELKELFDSAESDSAPASASAAAPEAHPCHRGLPFMGLLRGFGMGPGAMGGLFGRRRHHGPLGSHGHPGAAHAHPFARGPFGGMFGGGRGFGWRRRAAQQAAEEQAAQQAQSQQAQEANPLEDILGALFGVPQQQTAAPQQEAASSSAAAPSTDSAAKSDADGVHPHVLCDGCGQTPLRGLRWKCAVCPDFDLCSACEAKGAHPAHHPMLKLHPGAHAQQHGAGHGFGFGRGGRCEWRRAFHGHHGHGHHGHGGWRRHLREQAESAASGLPSARYIRDANLFDRSPAAPGVVLIKRWELSNDGALQWPEGVKLIFVRGDRELLDGAQEEFPVERAQPGQSVEAAAVLRTPSTPGRYQAFFRMATADRQMFGSRVWVDLMVQPEQAQAKDDTETQGQEQQQAEQKPEAEPEEEKQSWVSVLAESTEEKAATEPEAQSASATSSTPAAASPSSAAAEVAPEVVAPAEPAHPYSAQLQLLDEMGFTNRDLNAFLLDSKQGNVMEVASWLLEKATAK